MEALKELARFQTDRGLHLKPFDKKASVMNIMEELLELYGIGDNENRTLAKRMCLNLEINVDYAIELVKCGSKKYTYEVPTVDSEKDALADIQVFAGGDIMKLGDSNEKVLLEVAKEINSREGTFINGKFQKDKSPEAMAKWYKADFEGCKID